MRRIFVFGSNLMGLHYGGAARAARLEHGAQNQVGFGPTGDAYAIPTLCSDRLVTPSSRRLYPNQ